MLTIDGFSDLGLGSKHTSIDIDSSLNSYASSNMTSLRSRRPMPDEHIQRPAHMWIVTGPAGCGKSTVAAYLAKELDIPFIEGDDYHPASNRQKMTAGTPLTDNDRWDWLITLRQAAVDSLSPTSSSSTVQHTGVVVTCSALKRKYRDVIRVAAYNDHHVRVHFIYLHADESVLTARVEARKGHFMGAKMVHSQFDILEEPDRVECRRDVLTIDCNQSSQLVETSVLDKVRDTLAKEAW